MAGGFGGEVRRGGRVIADYFGFRISDFGFFGKVSIACMTSRAISQSVTRQPPASRGRR